MSQLSTDFAANASYAEDKIYYVDEPQEAPTPPGPPLQHDALLRIEKVLQLVPVSKASWYAGVKNGVYPPSIKLGARSVAWRMSDIRLVVAGRWNSTASA